MAGLIVSAAFPPFGILLAAPIGLIILFRRIRVRPEFALGFLYGVSLLAPLTWWFRAFHPLAPFAVVLVSAIPYGFAARFGTTPLRFAAAFTAAEFVRSVGVLALPWGVVGSLAADLPWRHLASWGGMFGLSFLLYLLAALIPRRPLVAILGIVVVSAVGVQLAPRASVETRSYGVVQGNFAMEEDYEFRPGPVREALWSATRRLADRGAKIIVWSETVILEYLNLPRGPQADIQALADETGATLIVGAPTMVSQEDKRNSAYVFTPGAPGPLRYDKVHLVPFGEFIPGWGPDRGHRLIPEGTGDFTGASWPVPVGGFGPLICYEGALGSIARAHVLLGARVLVNLSNDAWTRSPSEAEQHYALMKLRSAETRRPFVRAGNVGVSALIQSGGDVVAELSTGREGVLEGQLVADESMTPWVRYGDWPGWLCLLGVPFFLTVQGMGKDD